MADAMDVLEGEEMICKLLIRTRLDMEDEFAAGKKKKSVLWGQILTKIKDIYPNFDQSKEQITRKFLNLRTTYKRIKARNKESGRSATTWTFFEEFDEVYGTRHSIDPPEFNLISSLDETVEGNSSETCDDPQEDSPIPKKKKRGCNNEILQYLTEESQKEQKRHEEVLAMEEKKLLIEQQRIKAMMELKEVLEKAILIN